MPHKTDVAAAGRRAQPAGRRALGAVNCVVRRRRSPRRPQHRRRRLRGVAAGRRRLRPGRPALRRARRRRSGPGGGAGPGRGRRGRGRRGEPHRPTRPRPRPRWPARSADGRRPTTWPAPGRPRTWWSTPPRSAWARRSTPLGRPPRWPRCPTPRWSPISSTTRSSTPLLAAAAARGAAHASTGWGCSCTRRPWPSSCWTGTPAPVAEMRRAAEARRRRRLLAPASRFEAPRRARHPVRDASSRRPARKSSNSGTSLPMETVHSLLGGHRGSSGHARNLCPSRRSAPAGLDQEDRAAAADRWPWVGQHLARRRVDRRQRGQRRAARRRRRRGACSSCCGSRRASSSSTTTPWPPTAVRRPTSRPRSTPAEAMLDEWKSIEAVVPVAQRLGVAQRRAARATRSPSSVTAGPRSSPSAAASPSAAWATCCSSGELPVSRTVKELVELGLVTLGEAPERRRRPPPARRLRAPGRSSPTPEPAFEPVFEPSAELDDFAVAPEPEPRRRCSPSSTTRAARPFDRLVLAASRFDPGALVIEPPSFGGDAAAEPAGRSRTTRPTRPRSPASSPTSAPRRPRPSPRRPRPPPRRSARRRWPRSTTTRSRSTAASC